ncbi:MAG TPA: PH domain-containing protein [Candidatus Saccharimonadales bacterium]|nr:PH domain-containing protein [Candidatus Saccharimonadales bacterium]
MVTKESIEEQLKEIHYNYHGWGRTEINELPAVIMPDEKIFECVNGIYEGGFALLVATNFRVLLIDKKPLNYLTVEDLRFDMISEIDYSHRLLGARISISTGSKNLRFLSYNQPRLRKLVTHVQNTMAEIKKRQSEHEEGQKTHLEQINQQLQAYLLAQHQQQQKIQQQLEKSVQQPSDVQPVKPTPELADYLYAQSLLAQYNDNRGTNSPPVEIPPAPAETAVAPAVTAPEVVPTSNDVLAASDARAADLYKEGMNEVFGHVNTQASQPASAAQQPSQQVSAPPLPTPVQQQSQQALSPLYMTAQAVQHALEINPLRIAHSKLPLAMRNKKFGRPSFHAHSQASAIQEDAPGAPSEIAPVHS